MNNVKTKDVQSFSVLYQNICDKLRSSGTVEETMNKFMDCSSTEKLDMVLNTQEVIDHQITELANTKDEKKAQMLLKKYGSLIENENMKNEAMVVINKCIQLTPIFHKDSLAERYNKRAWCHLLLEEFANAKKDVDRYFSLISTEVQWKAHEIVGHCETKSENYKKAKHSFMEALNGLRKSSTSQEEKAKITQRICLVLKSISSRKQTKHRKQTFSKSQSKPLPSPIDGRHLVLKSMSSKIEVFWTRSRGRSLLAVRDIRPGDVLIVEDATTAVVNECEQHNYCVACFCRLAAPVPCDNCSLVWYCSEACKTKCVMHKKECGILGYLQDDSLGKLAPLVFRTVLNTEWEKLKTQITSQSKANFLTEEQTEGKYNLKKNLHTNSIWDLTTNEELRTFGDLFKRIVSAVFISDCLKKVGYIKADCTKQDLIIAIKAILHHLQACSCNAYEISDYRVTNSVPFPGKLTQIGGAVYPTISLSNHSCYPNASRYSVGTSCVLRATRFIPKNTEIFDNYGYYYHSCSKKERHALLKSQYMFECNCIACINDWALYSSDDVYLCISCPSGECFGSMRFHQSKKFKCNQCQCHNESITSKTKTGLAKFEKSKVLLSTSQWHMALPILLEHQQFIDQHCLPPSRHVTELQEAIIHCYYANGNTSISNVS